MIDLHCHLLPGIDDGAKDLSVSLEMGRLAAADGITTIVCTPHILPSVYDNVGPEIRAHVAALQVEMEKAQIPLRLLPGADVHIAPDLVAGLQDGRVLSVADSRYMLFEPPHHVVPPRLEDCAFGLMAAGYMPILTHPERLSWIEGRYDVVKRLAHAGVLMQITAGSFLGRFGGRPKRWADTMLEDGIVDIIATDAHDTHRRGPKLSEACSLVAERCGDEAVRHMVLTRPRGIIDNLEPSKLPLRSAPQERQVKSGWRQALGRLVTG